MKRFRFPLRPVAILRAHQENRAREAFAAAVHTFIKSEQVLAETRQRVAEFEAALAAGRRGRFSGPSEARAMAAYANERRAEAETEKRMEEAREKMQLRRTDYLEAHRRVEVVSRLEDKARGEHREDCNREEQIAFDEFAGRQVAARATNILS